MRACQSCAPRIAGSTVYVAIHVSSMPVPAIPPNWRNPRKSVIKSDVYDTVAMADDEVPSC